ncbi:MAG: DUF4974 domain-containing protein [Marinilabiliaceae bacterium]|nr:DUF4974 domain-containing protein [Marinilabiliaceae bacterium]
MDINNKHIKDLINRYFLGKVTEQEAGELTHWLHASSDHMAQFDAAKDQWQGAQDDLWAKTNWSVLKSRMQRLNQLDLNLAPQRRKRFPVWQAASAALFIMLIGLSGLFIQKSQNQAIDAQALVFETPRGQRSRVILGDSTVVWLNAESRLEVTAFNSNKRTVTLSGQAHFNVTRNEEAPFTVKTQDYDVNVLGTVFDVMAYADMNRTVTTLLEGKVQITRDVNVYDLKPGEQAIWAGEVLNIEKVKDVERAEAWVNNDFYFDDVPLEELLIRLGRWYDVEFEYKPDDLDDLRFSGAFKNEETIWQVLNIIKLYIPIKYEKTDLRKVKITRQR